MKNIITKLIAVLLIFSAGVVFAGTNPFKVFVDDKEVKNSDDYIIQNNKVYVSQDALSNELGINVFNEKNENRVRVCNITKQQLQSRCNDYENFVSSYEIASADAAVSLWVKGIQERNGVLQYAALSKLLKTKFKENMNKSSNLAWVTGWSSPWIESCKITKQKDNNSTPNYSIVFTGTTSDKKTYYYNASLTVGKENGTWRITALKSDI